MHAFNSQTAGSEMLRKRMVAAREAGNVRSYLTLRRRWLSVRQVYGVLHPTRADRSAFDHVESPRIGEHPGPYGEPVRIIITSGPKGSATKATFGEFLAAFFVPSHEVAAAAKALTSGRSWTFCHGTARGLTIKRDN